MYMPIDFVAIDSFVCIGEAVANGVQPSGLKLQTNRMGI